MPSYRFGGFTPVVDPSAFVHPMATLIGDVHVGARCYVAPGAVMRGDMGPIRMGEQSNLQDNCVIHSFPDQPVVLHRRSHIGHAAVLHGCEIGENVLIGMNAVIMDGVVVGEHSFVGAQSFVKAGERIPASVLALGAPARVIRPLTPRELAWKVVGTDAYVTLAARCLDGLEPCAPLRQAPDGEAAHAVSQTPPLHVLKQRD